MKKKVVSFCSKYSNIQFGSVTQSCPTLWDPMNRSTPGLPVHYQLPEFTQTHVHWVGDASSHLILCCPLLLLPPIPPSFRRDFPISQLFAWGSQSIGVSASTSVLPMTQDWSPLGWTGWIFLLSKGLSRVFSNTMFKSISSPVLRFLYSPTLNPYDYWKNHSFD